MLKYVNYNIVFQEIPNETSLAINISGCPNRCPGCHSTALQANIGQDLNTNTLTELLTKYKNSISCVAFMGGDNSPQMIEELASFIKTSTFSKIKTAWYSGKDTLPTDFSIHSFNYIKLGAYIEKLGALDSKHTNQRFFKIEKKQMIDKTYHFTKKKNFVAV